MFFQVSRGIFLNNLVVYNNFVSEARFLYSHEGNPRGSDVSRIHMKGTREVLTFPVFT